MHRRRELLGALAAALLAATTPAFAQAPAPDSAARKVLNDAAKALGMVRGLNRSLEVVNAFEYTAKYDGKDYPVTGSDTIDMIALKRINDRTTEATLKKSGKVVSTARRVVSKDGKMLTLTITGTNAKGQKMKNIAVYDKQ